MLLFVFVWLLVIFVIRFSVSLVCSLVLLMMCLKFFCSNRVEFCISLKIWVIFLLMCFIFLLRMSLIDLSILDIFWEVLFVCCWFWLFVSNCNEFIWKKVLIYIVIDNIVVFDVYYLEESIIKISENILMNKVRRKCLFVVNVIVFFFKKIIYV